MFIKLISSISSDFRNKRVSKAYFLAAFIVLTSTGLYGQGNYFQQHVDYDIKVSLNDETQFLTGTIKITYTNNSPDMLPFIWIHLWPNAYSDRSTALTRQLLEDGTTNLFFAKDIDRGFIDKLEFTSGGKSLLLIPDSLNPDIAKLQLLHPLIPGEKIEISTPFRVKIPSGKFSRLGHIGESYQISQWYPKPAVYDKQGWHQMPYLNEGEFYSEFGSFKVAITLPQNYVVAATGVLQEQKERDWLLEKVKSTNNLISFDTTLAFPPSDTIFKTITFTQDSIHDFAWFADKRFNVMKSDIQLMESGRTVEAWSFFTNHKTGIWKKGLGYIESGMQYYSDKIGEYPYPAFSIVDGTITAGIGMEYPMITVLGGNNSAFEFEISVVHELGHNWFYGMLASNERDHGWMDEGMNTAYEIGYVENQYPGESGIGKNELEGYGLFSSILGTKSTRFREFVQTTYLSASYNNSDQPIETKSQDFTFFNYGAVMYDRTGLAFGFLENYLGSVVFDKAMKDYFNTWKFKHPYPQDLKNSFEKSTGKNLDWFFGDIISTNKPVKYKITKTSDAGGRLQINLVNNDSIAPPVKLGLEGQKALWFDGFKGEKSIVIDDYKGEDLKIYENYSELLKRNHTIYRNRTLFPSVPNVKLRMVPKLEQDPDVETFLLLPMVAWNRYNEFMAGVTFSNFSFVPKRFEFSLTPLYDFKNEDIAGIGSLNYNIWPLDGILSRVTIGVQGKRFAYAENTYGKDEIVDPVKPVLTYSKLAPGVTLNFRKKRARSTLQHSISYRNISIWLDEVGYEFKDSSYQRQNMNTYQNFNELAYRITNKRTLDPYSGTVRIEQGSNYSKISGEFKYRFSYAKFKKGVDVRVFAGGFLDNGNANTRNNNFRMSGWDGSQDYLYDELYFGRTDDGGLWKQQFLVRDGGFKTPTVVGQSNKWIAALNLDIELPVPIPISIFTSIGTYEGISDIFSDLNNQVMYEGGLAFKPFRDILEIYVPLFYSDDINQTLELNNVDFWEQIRFVFNINNITPYAIRNRYNSN